MWLVHVQSESCDHYYKVFKTKPTQEQILEFQKKLYRSEFQEEPGEYFTDLIGVRNVVEVEIE